MAGVQAGRSPFQFAFPSRARCRPPGPEAARGCSGLPYRTALCDGRVAPRALRCPKPREAPVPASVRVPVGAGREQRRAAGRQSRVGQRRGESRAVAPARVGPNPLPREKRAREARGGGDGRVPLPAGRRRSSCQLGFSVPHRRPLPSEPRPGEGLRSRGRARPGGSPSPLARPMLPRRGAEKARASLPSPAHLDHLRFQARLVRGRERPSRSGGSAPRGPVDVVPCGAGARAAVSPSRGSREGAEPSEGEENPKKKKKLRGGPGSPPRFAEGSRPPGSASSRAPLSPSGGGRRLCRRPCPGGPRASVRALVPRVAATWLILPVAYACLKA